VPSLCVFRANPDSNPFHIGHHSDGIKNCPISTRNTVRYQTEWVSAFIGIRSARKRVNMFSIASLYWLTSKWVPSEYSYRKLHFTRGRVTF
jgi:hypothetical protein